MPEQREKKSGWRAKLGLALCVGLSTVIVSELAAQFLLRHSFHAGERRSSKWNVLGAFDAKVGWGNEPGAAGEIVTADFRYRASINSLGFRDPKMAIAKRAGVRRVLFLGDSVTWGWGVGDGERFTDLLGQKLGPRIEVVNTAVPGFGTDQELWTLESRGEALAPDLVVLVFGINDIVECDQIESYGLFKPRFVFAGGSWKIEGSPVPDPRTALWRWFGPLIGTLRSHSALWAGMERWRGGEEPAPAVEGDRRGRPYKPQFAEQVREVSARLLEEQSPARHALSLIRAWCAAHSVPFALVVVPHKHDQYLYEPLDERPEFDGTTALTKALVRVGAELDFPVFNVDAAMFAATGSGQRLHCGDGHLNQAGNRLLADALKPQIEAWLPPLR